MSGLHDKCLKKKNEKYSGVAALVLKKSNALIDNQIAGTSMCSTSNFRLYFLTKRYIFVWRSKTLLDTCVRLIDHITSCKAYPNYSFQPINMINIYQKWISGSLALIKGYLKRWADKGVFF